MIEVINLRKNRILKASLSQMPYVLCSLLLILSTFADQMYSFETLKEPLHQITQNSPLASDVLGKNLPLVKVNTNDTTPLPFKASNWISRIFDSSLVFPQYESWERTGKIFRDTNVLKP